MLQGLYNGESLDRVVEIVNQIMHVMVEPFELSAVLRLLRMKRDLAAEQMLERNSRPGLHRRPSQRRSCRRIIGDW
jgi:hypothetical protein